MPQSPPCVVAVDWQRLFLPKNTYLPREVIYYGMANLKNLKVINSYAEMVINLMFG